MLIIAANPALERHYCKSGLFHQNFPIFEARIPIFPKPTHGEKQLIPISRRPLPITAFPSPTLNANSDRTTKRFPLPDPWQLFEGTRAVGFMPAIP
ncbi:hypothetical protein [Microbaculum sp. FT89]|uniref:hypothetical protein n=1 Tax=Microbaculum sp. FT89 TaxID=3447298 RepID=UPI003F52F1E7